MSKNNKRCIHNIKGYCCLGKSKYFSKPCNLNCNKRVYYNSFYSSNNFDVTFLRVKDNLILEIKIPIDYNKFHKVLKGNIWTFQCTKKDKDITVQILINSLNAYIEFLFNGFDKNIYVKSGYLYIILDHVQEITNNKTPYNKLKKKIKIKRTIKNKFGRLNLTIFLGKELVFTSVYKLFKNKSIDNNGSLKNKTKDERCKLVSNNTSNIIQSHEKENFQEKQNIHINAIVLSHNRKCIFEYHKIVDVNAIIRTAQGNGNILDASIPAVYCKECGQYIILKSDYKTLKKKGALLCKVTDKTPKYIEKHKNSSYNGTESKVHSLGYNVIKQGYNYTFEQRKIILANIIENYGITQHEILSMLDTNIARKINLPNYADAIQKWEQDREFVKNYKIGDCQEVIVDEIIVGKRN